MIDNLISLEEQESAGKRREHLEKHSASALVLMYASHHGIKLETSMTGSL